MITETNSKGSNTIMYQFILLIFLGVIIMIGGCVEDEEPPIKTSGFDIDLFETNLRDSFTANCVGMQYSIIRNENISRDGAIGKARLSNNPPETDYNTTHRKSVQSCSKTLTSLALLAVLKEKNLTKDDLLVQFLPSSWSFQTGLLDITFKDMLIHRTAIDDSVTIDPAMGQMAPNGTYESMKSYALHGGLRANKSWHYANTNFTLLRVAIAYLLEGGEIEDMIQSGNEADVPAFVAETYVQAVRDYILIPAGVDSRADVRIWDDNTSDFSQSSCSYNFKNLSLSGYVHYDQRLTGSGAGGWYLNANEYAAVMAAFFNEKYALLDVEEVTTTGELTSRLGMYNRIYTNGDFSRSYFTHNGAFDDGFGRGGRAIWIHIPNENVQVMIQINSANNDFTIREAETAIMRAYENAFS